MMNTKAKFMIVTPTSPQKSTLILVNNVISTIVPPPYISLTTKSRGVVSKHQRVKGGNALRLFLFSIIYIIVHIYSSV